MSTSSSDNPLLLGKISDAQNLVHLVQNQQHNASAVAVVSGMINDMPDLDDAIKHRVGAAVGRIHDLGAEGDIESLSEIPELNEIGGMASSMGPNTNTKSQR